MQNVIVIILTVVVSFLLGSIPCGVIVSKVFYGRDVRNEGSGNIGFTNSMRSLGKLGGGVVFAGDFLKGLLATLIAMFFSSKFFTGEILFCANSTDFFLGSATFCATMGHIFSPWLGWKGGKGISTAFGASFASMSVLAACALFASFLLVVLITKHVSAGSLTAAVLYPIFGIVTRWQSPLACVFLAITGFVVIWAHRENITRLRLGTERKIGRKE